MPARMAGTWRSFVPITARSDANPYTVTHLNQTCSVSYIGGVFLKVSMVVDLRLRHTPDLKDRVAVPNAPVQISTASTVESE